VVPLDFLGAFRVARVGIAGADASGERVQGPWRRPCASSSPGAAPNGRLHRERTIAALETSGECFERSQGCASSARVDCSSPEREDRTRHGTS